MLKVFSHAIIAAAVVAVTVSSATAQQDGNRRGGRGGFGGFGLGGLVAMPEVQKELALSEADAKKLNDAIRELYPPRPEGGGDRTDFRSLSEEERNKRFAEMRKQGEETAKKVEAKVKSSVTDAQWKRLSELRVQREGTGSLERAEIADKVKLTDEQKEKIRTLAAGGRPQFGRPGGGNNAGGERPTREEMRARREKRNAEIMAVLTPEQKMAFENLKGAKFDFPERSFGGGRGRGNQRPATE